MVYLGAIRHVIALVHACETDKTLLVANRQQPDSDFRAAADAYLVFVVSIQIDIVACYCMLFY